MTVPSPGAAPAQRPFELHDATESVVAHGVSTEFTTLDQARAAAHSGPVVGALAFSGVRRPALWMPEHLERGAAQPIRAATARPPLTLRSLTTPAAYAAAVGRVHELIAAGAAEKVVLSRELIAEAATALDPAAVLADFRRASTTGSGFRVALDSGGLLGHELLGSSPELLVQKHFGEVLCFPVAGTAARHRDRQLDAAAAQALLASAKDRHEHGFVVQHLREVLAPFVTTLSAPDTPELVQTDRVWHLGTPIRAVLRDEIPLTALDLAAITHPTPAVCGFPTRSAHDIIAELDPDRGFYAGAVGFSDAEGNGRWLVSIRCLELGADRRTITARAGGGLVAQSDPTQEVAETVAKFGTVLGALGAPDLLAT